MSWKGKQDDSSGGMPPIPVNPNVDFKSVVFIGVNRFVFDTAKEAATFKYFIKNGVEIDLALKEVERLKKEGKFDPPVPDAPPSTQEKW